ncbi:MAG: hypothetical protein ACRCV6_08800 [Formosimonas sp.]
MDNCWAILGIDATQNLRDIKRAYAKLLKVTRPDQDPQGFTRLHEAYQEAQWLAQSEWAWESDVSSQISLAEAVNVEPAANSTLERNTHSIHVADDAQAFFNDMLLPNEWLKQLEHATYAEQLTLSDWNMLLKPAAQFDDEIRAHAIHIVVKRIYRWYLHNKQRSPQLFWDKFHNRFLGTGWEQPTLQFVAQQLGWWNIEQQDWQKEYDHYFIWSLRSGTATLAEIQQLEKNNPAPEAYLSFWRNTQGIQEASLKRLALAKLIDGLLALMSIVVFKHFFFEFSNTSYAYLEFSGILFFLLGLIASAFLPMLLLGQSKFQSTIGLYLTNTKLVNSYGLSVTRNQQLKFYSFWFLKCTLLCTVVAALAAFYFVFTPDPRGQESTFFFKSFITVLLAIIFFSNDTQRFFKDSLKMDNCLVILR